MFNIDRCNFDAEGFPIGFLNEDIYDDDDHLAVLIRVQGRCVDNHPPSFMMEIGRRNGTKYIVTQWNKLVKEYSCDFIDFTSMCVVESG